jgi:hypothetical protein
VTDAGAVSRLAAARSRLEPLGGVTVVALGYATVDLDEAEDVAKSRFGDVTVRPAPDDALLGARCRIVVVASGPWIVLLEPATEGRLAASLARYGQVPVAEYLATTSDDANAMAAAASAGIALSPRTAGPFGLERLVLDGAPWGPHLILVEEDSRGATGPPAATIER